MGLLQPLSAKFKQKFDRVTDMEEKQTETKNPEKKVKKKKISPILLIIISACLGILFF